MIHSTAQGRGCRGCVWHTLEKCGVSRSVNLRAPEVVACMTMPNRPAGRAICLSLVLGCLFRIACAQVYDSPVAVVQTAEPHLDSPVQKSRSEPSSGSALRFRDLSSEAGLITVPHTTTERRYVVDMMSGGGIALVDCDGDGRLDVVVVNDSSIERYLAGGDRMV